MPGRLGFLIDPENEVMGPPSGPDQLAAMFGDEGGGQESDLEAIIQRILGRTPATADREGPVGDLTAGIPGQGMVRLGGGRVQDLGDLRRSAAIEAIKGRIGRDPRSTPMVEVGRQRFWVNKDGSVTPVARVRTDLAFGDTTRLPEAVMKGLTTEEVQTGAPIANRARIFSEAPEVSENVLAQAQAKAKALLAREAERLPDELEAGLLGAAGRLRPGEDPAPIFQALIQRSQTERTEGQRKRHEAAFKEAMARAGFAEGVRGRKAREAAAAEDRATKAEGKRREVLSVAVTRFGNLKEKLAGAVADGTISAADARTRLDEQSKLWHSQLDPDLQALFEAATKFSPLELPAKKEEPPPAGGMEPAGEARVTALTGEPVARIRDRLLDAKLGLTLGPSSTGVQRENTKLAAEEVLKEVEAGDIFPLFDIAQTLLPPGTSLTTPKLGEVGRGRGANVARGRLRERAQAEFKRLVAGGLTEEDAYGVLAQALMQILQKEHVPQKRGS